MKILNGMYSPIKPYIENNTLNAKMYNTARIDNVIKNLINNLIKINILGSYIIDFN